MSIICTAHGPISEKDAVCITGWDLAQDRPEVSRASASNLAICKTVFGIAGQDANIIDPDANHPVLVFTGGDAIPSSKTGLGNGESRVVVTNYSEPADKDQCKI